MEPIKIDKKHALQINLAFAKALPTVHAGDGASDVISISQRAESALGAIRLPKTLRSGASLMYTHRPNDERGVEVILSRRSEYWYMTNVSAVQAKDQTLKALVLTPKQYDKAFLYNCSWIKIWRGEATKNEVIHIQRHLDKATDKATDKACHLVTFYFVGHSYPLFAVVSPVDSMTLVFETDALGIASVKPLDASKYDGWLRVQISKWEARRKQT